MLVAGYGAVAYPRSTLDLRAPVAMLKVSSTSPPQATTSSSSAASSSASANGRFAVRISGLPVAAILNTPVRIETTCTASEPDSARNARVRAASSAIACGSEPWRTFWLAEKFGSAEMSSVKYVGWVFAGSRASIVIRPLRRSSKL
jgi:hypothetical protein